MKNKDLRYDDDWVEGLKKRLELQLTPTSKTCSRCYELREYARQAAKERGVDFKPEPFDCESLNKTCSTAMYMKEDYSNYMNLYFTLSSEIVNKTGMGPTLIEKFNLDERDLELIIILDQVYHKTINELQEIRRKQSKSR
jgi:hypothetical protein